MTHHPNTPASRTEQAAPSVASGVEVDQREAFLDHWVKDVPVEYRAAARERADKDLLLDLGRGPLRIAADAWQAGYALAAPGAAIAAREQESSPGFTTKYPLLNDLLQETWWLGKGPNNHDTGMAWFESLERFLEWLASRQEAPAASAPALSKKDLNKLLNDFARACAPGEDLRARMAASKAIHEYLDAAFAAAARSPATVAQPVAVVVTRKRLDGSTRRAPELFEAFEDLPNGTRLYTQPCPSQGCGGDGGEAVHVEAVATVVKRRHGLEWELELDWLAEGGINSLAEGAVLLLADSALTDDEGSGTVYRAALSTDKGDGGSKE